MTMMFWHRRRIVTPESNIGTRIESLVERSKAVQQAVQLFNKLFNKPMATMAGNAELQKARNGLTTMFVKRRSQITPKTTLNSRTTHYGQVQRAKSKSLSSFKVTKRLREISS